MHISTSFIGTKNLETQLTLIDILYEENQGIKIELLKKKKKKKKKKKLPRGVHELGLVGFCSTCHPT
jgi:hypothetical protein